MNSRFSLLVTSLTLASAGCAIAQNTPTATAPNAAPYVKETGITYGPWRSTVLGSGGYLQHVVTCPTNPKRYYMTSDVGGLYRSDDSGQNWQMLHGHLPASGGNYEVRGLVVDPRDDKKVIIATGSAYGSSEGIYVSEDAGLSWKKTLTARFVGNGGSRWAGRILARDAKNPNLLFTASIGDGVFKSVDNGLTWTKSGGEALLPNDLVIDRINSNRLWLSAGSGKIKGIDYKTGFYRSEDGGMTWATIEGPTPSELVQDPKEANSLFGIFNGAFIRKSTDGGTTWVDFYEGLPTEAPEAGKGKPSISKTTYRAITVGPDFILTCNTSDADFFKLPSGATKWEKVPREKVVAGDWYGAHNNWYFGGAAGSITVDVNDPTHWFVTDYGALWQTNDAGKNWRLTIDGVEMTVVHCLTQDPTDPAVIHIGVADVGASTSTDGGRRLIADKVLNEGSDKNGGGNMKAIDLSPKLPNRLYGVGNKNYQAGWASNQVFISIDRGQTWRRSPMAGLPNMDTQRCTTIAVDPNDPYTVYITMSGTINSNWGGVYKSTDGGASWTWISQGLSTGKYYFPSDIWAHGRQISVGQDGTLIALGQADNLVYRFDPKTNLWSNTGLRSKNGKLWSVVADPLRPNRFFIGAQNDGIYRTDDAGLTWKKVYNQGAGYVAVDGVVAGRVAAGTSDGVILSTDGGDTWKELDKSLPYRTLNIPAFSGNRLLVGSGGSGVFWMPLSSAGEKNPVAKPLTVAEVPASDVTLPPLINLDFEQAGEPVPGWTLSTTAGTATIDRNAKAGRGTPNGLLITAQAGTVGTVTQEFVPTTSLMTFSGSFYPRGNWKKVRIELQSLDANNQVISTSLLGSGLGEKKWWEGYNQSMGLPRGTKKCRLAVVFEGEGSIYLDSFSVSKPTSIFRETRLAN